MRSMALWTRSQRERRKRLVRILCLTLLVFGTRTGAEYTEIDQVRSFGLIDVEGSIRVGYLFDERDYGSTVSNSSGAQGSWEEEFYLRTRSFVYHPGFLNMIVGGGPVLVQRQFDSPNGEISDSETLFNFESRLNFLDLKSYPFSLYYRRSHPSITRGQAGRFVIENDDYGFIWNINRLFNDSTGLGFELKRRDARGDSFGYSLNDQTESAVITLQTSFRTRDQLSFKYDRLQVDSESGSPGLPIHRSNLTNKLLEARLENRFGENDQIRVSQVLSRLRRANANASVSELDDHRYRGIVGWEPSEKTIGKLRYNYSDSRRLESSSLTRNLDLSLLRRPSNKSAIEFGLEHLDQSSTGFERLESALRGSVTLRPEVAFGVLAIGSTIRGSRTNQESSASDTPVFDEAIELSGTIPVDLANQFVVRGSVSVRNILNTQIFIEGLDYRLIETGSFLSIQRLIGGNIGDGETVLVDYRYLTSGTSSFDTLDSSVSVNVGFLRNFNAHVRYSITDTNIRSGELINRVNDRDRLEFGLSVRNRALDGVAITGNFRHIEQDEDISPFTSDSLDISLAKNFWGRLNASFTAGFVKTDYEFSVEDLDQVSYAVSLSGSHYRFGSIGYDIAYLEDVGGTVPRTQLRHRLSFQWAYRQMRVMLRGHHAVDELGESDRLDNRVTFQITREF